MFLHNGKEYYPVEVSKIYGRGKTKIYDRDERNKPYAYIVIVGQEKKEENK